DDQTKQPLPGSEGLRRHREQSSSRGTDPGDLSTRSGKVTCGIEIHAPAAPATDVLCAARGIPAPKQAGVGDSGFVELGVLGEPQLLRLSQDSFVAGRSVTLGRGRLWNQLGVTCHVALTTVLCFNGDNHGFVIGNGHYTSF
ncbi:MAG: hypothetical protein ACLP50_19170, partial [Solirubrobacteraceae bacterium]